MAQNSGGSYNIGGGECVRRRSGSRFGEPCSSLLERGLVELCALKPKYPTLNTKESALKFLAVFLKAHNPAVKAKHLKARHGARLHDFTECCSLADRLLAAKKGSVESQAAGATELERLAGMWDDCKARDLADFLK